MRLHTLERELSERYRFMLARIRGHRIYRDAAGHTLTIAAHDCKTKTFCRAELCAIRRDVRRLRTEAARTAAAGGSDAP